MTHKRIRVLHVIQNLNYGGMERVLADIVLGSDADRFESHVLCLEFLGRFSEGLEDVASLHVADPGGPGSMLRPHSLTRQIARIAPDVVHTHSGVWYKASLAARRCQPVTRVARPCHGALLSRNMSRSERACLRSSTSGRKGCCARIQTMQAIDATNGTNGTTINAQEA